MKLNQAALCLEDDCQEVFALFAAAPFTVDRTGTMRMGTVRTSACPSCGSTTWHPVSKFMQSKA